MQSWQSLKLKQSTITIVTSNMNTEQFLWPECALCNVCDTQIIWKSWLKMVGLKFMDGNEIHICVTRDFPHVAERRLFQSFIFLCSEFHICVSEIYICVFVFSL